MLLFIISEVMVFGAFFTAYFFIRVVNGDQWFPTRGHRCRSRWRASTPHPGVVVVHAALGADVDQDGNRFGLKAGILSTFLLGLTFLFIQINEYVHIGFAPQRHRAGLDLLRPDRPARRARLRRPDAAARWSSVRSFRGHYSPEEHRGVEVPGIYWHFVDVMWIVVYMTVYVL